MATSQVSVRKIIYLGAIWTWDRTRWIRGSKPLRALLFLGLWRRHYTLTRRKSTIDICRRTIRQSVGPASFHYLQEGIAVLSFSAHLRAPENRPFLTVSTLISVAQTVGGDAAIRHHVLQTMVFCPEAQIAPCGAAAGVEYEQILVWTDGEGS
jgi:hypothetical protein